MRYFDISIAYISLHLFLYKSLIHLPYTDALVNSAEGFEDEQTSVFDEVLETRHQEKVIHQHLQEIETSTLHIIACYRNRDELLQTFNGAQRRLWLNKHNEQLI